METDPLVSADWLMAHHSLPNVRVVDATWVPPFLKDRPDGRASYLVGHIPGAGYFDIDDIADTKSALSHMLPNAVQFGEKVGALGIDNDTHVIVYDNNGFFASARAWWMFRAMGHQEVSVLDGGLTAWTSAGGALETEPVSAQPVAFQARQIHDLVRDQDDMRAHVEAQDARILDARDPGRFNGTSPEPRPELPSGHMPGSFCVPASALINSDKTLKSHNDLEPILAPHLDAPVITTCGSGVSAAVIALALARLGQWSAALYDGSWSEWAANTENAIETHS